MKRILITVLAAVLVLFLTACGAQKQPAEPAAPETETAQNTAPSDSADAAESNPSQKKEETPAPASEPTDSEANLPKEHFDPQEEDKASLDSEAQEESLTVQAFYDTDHPEPDCFQEPPTDYDQEVYFRTQHTVTEFHFFAVDWGDPSGSGEPQEGDVLYTQAELTPETDLMIVTSFPGDMPSRGISYTDNGVRKAYTLSMSGMDGSFVLTPMG